MGFGLLAWPPSDLSKILAEFDLSGPYLANLVHAIILSASLAVLCLPN